jgi:hypothetical protein
MNHRSYKRIKDDYKDQGFSDRKAHLKTLNDLEKGGSPSALRELQKNRREDLFNVKAGYNPYFNSLFHTKYASKLDQVDIAKAHEMQHAKDMAYLRGKYGKQRANTIFRKMKKLKYYNIPTELNAHQAGYDKHNGDNTDRSKEYQQRLDNFVKTGKSKETVPENQK